MGRSMSESEGVYLRLEGRADFRRLQSAFCIRFSKHGRKSIERKKLCSAL